MKSRGDGKKRDQVIAEAQAQINRGECPVIEVVIGEKHYRLDSDETYEKYGDIVLAELKRRQMRLRRDQGFRRSR